ncbi:MAG: TlpA family protein disulfide reductase [Pseudobdellovibrionaceae bacterium]
MKFILLLFTFFFATAPLRPQAAEESIDKSATTINAYKVNLDENKNVIYNRSNVTIDKNSPRTVLIIWTSWCPHCTRLFSELKTKGYSTHLKNYKLIGLSVDAAKPNFEKAIKGNDGHRLSDNYWIHPKDIKDKPWSKIPTILIFDKSGELSRVLEGQSSVDDLLKRLK